MQEEVTDTMVYLSLPLNLQDLWSSKFKERTISLSPAQTSLGCKEVWTDSPGASCPTTVTSD